MCQGMLEYEPISLLELRIGRSSSSRGHRQCTRIPRRRSCCTVRLQTWHASVEVSIAWRHVLLGRERAWGRKVERGLLRCGLLLLLLLLRLAGLESSAWYRAGVWICWWDGHAAAETTGLVAVAVRARASCNQRPDAVLKWNNFGVSQPYIGRHLVKSGLPS